MALILDLDGVVWRGNDCIEGVSQAIKILRDHGQRVIFVTNNSYPTRSMVCRRLRSCGVDSSVDDIVTSSLSAATLIKIDSSVLIVGGPGIEEAVNARGARIVKIDQKMASGENFFPDFIFSENPEFVIVGIDPDITYTRIFAACVAIENGATFIATNVDPTYPTDKNRLAPGAGSIVEAIKTVCKTQPIIAGKPSFFISKLIKDSLKESEEIEMVVGDRIDTDGALASSLNTKFGLVLSGVINSKNEIANIKPEIVSERLIDLVEKFFG